MFACVDNLVVWLALTKELLVVEKTSWIISELSHGLAIDLEVT